MRQELKDQLKRIERHARRTFGSDYSEKWLRSPSRYFNGETPLEYADEVSRAANVLEHIRCYERGSIV